MTKIKWNSGINRLGFLCGFILLSLPLIQSAHAMDGLWEPLGPEGGSFLNAVIHPDDKSQVTAFTADPSCVYRTHDGGQNWAIIGKIEDQYISDLYIHDFETIYALCYNNLYKSNDGGATWRVYSIPSDSGTPYRLCGHPSNPNLVCAVGFYYNWQIGIPTMRMVFFKSTDGGKQFKASRHFSFESFYPMDIFIAPSNPDVIYVAGYKYENQMYCSALFRSTDGGRQWTDLSDKMQTQEYETFNCGIIDPTNEDNVYVIGQYCYTSQDGGENWKKGTRQMSASSLAFDSADPGKLLAGGYGEYYYSTNGRRWYTIRPNPAINGSYTNFAFSPSDPSTRYLCTSQSLYKSTDTGRSWEIAQNGIYNSIVPALAVSPSDPRAVYVEQQNVNVLSSSDGGDSWEASNQFLACGNTCALLVHPTNPQKVLALEGYG